MSLSGDVPLSQSGTQQGLKSGWSSGGSGRRVRIGQFVQGIRPAVIFHNAHPVTRNHALNCAMHFATWDPIELSACRFRYVVNAQWLIRRNENRRDCRFNCQPPITMIPRLEVDCEIAHHPCSLCLELLMSHSPCHSPNLLSHHAMCLRSCRIARASFPWLPIQARVQRFRTFRAIAPS